MTGDTVNDFIGRALAHGQAGTRQQGLNVLKAGIKYYHTL